LFPIPLARLAAGIVLALSASVAAAQGYPNKPIRIIVPFATGSATDTVGRVWGQSLSEILGQPVIVENKAGANGSIGADFVAKSAPDGYTLLWGTNTTNAAIRSLQKNVPFDPEKDFAPISFLGSIPLLVCVNNDFPAKTLMELIAYAKANPEKVTFATASASQRVSSEMLASMAGVKMTAVPYKSSPNAVTDLMSGQVNVFTADQAVTLQQYRAGKIRCLAVTSLRRSSQAPELPTVAEAGNLPGYELIAFFVAMAPAGTPKDVIAKLNDAIRKAGESRELRERFAGIGYEVQTSSPEQLAERLRAESAKWSKAAKEAGIVPE
jgi:tripartite-type tricarboxylate transporter receptor subunit TctC